MTITDPERLVLERCRDHLASWRDLPEHQFRFTPPRGFSSFTMAVRCSTDVTPGSVLYRQLEDKENAILDFADEQRVYRLLADHEIAPRCHAYERDYRLEEFYDGRTLDAADLRDPRILRQIGEQLARFHSLRPRLPDEPFFERLYQRWGPVAQEVLVEERHRFPEPEQAMCEELIEILDPEIRTMVRRCLPDDDLVFCHNDTYHGNVMLLADGRVRLLDFEFACLNHRAFDFSNLFAETAMRHGLDEYPYFDIAERTARPADLEALIDGYLDHCDDSLDRDTLLAQTESMMLLSHYMYAMAALPLALEPIQKIRFIPYALRRFRKFQELWRTRFASA